MKHIALFALLAVALLACSDSEDLIYPVERSITRSVYASGMVISTSQYQVFASTSGIVAGVSVVEGDTVTVGQTIAEIDNAQATLSENNAAIAAEFASVRNNSERLEELSAAIRIAALKRTDDSLMVMRQRRLFQQGVGSRLELEQRELAAANAKTSHESTILRYAQLQKQLAFTARQASINKQISGATANDLAVRSELNGVVFAVLKEKGEAVSPQTPIAIIGSPSTFKLELQVDEYDIASIYTGQTAYITLDSYPDTVFSATITKVHPMMDARTKSFTVEANFSQPPPRLFANLTVEANIVIAKKDRALLVPRSYVTKDGYVKLADGSTKKVVQGLRDFKMTEILSGVTVSDALVQP